MRRTVAAALVALSTTLTVVPAMSASATDPTSPASPTSTAATPGSRGPAQRGAAQVLARADNALAGVDTAAESAGRKVEGSIALRDLFLARGRLRGDDRARADALLARPTDGASDPQGFGYTTSAKRKCRNHICIHWVQAGSDAPPSMAWVNKNLQLMNRVWSFEVGKLGYRRPLTDSGVGGNSKFDVYLEDLGSRGLYGFCAPEYRSKKNKWLASGYCVLDNDFARSQFGSPPANSLKVTAAHEFFHAVQFAYDYGEDSWFMESTATWMEERFADQVNDNRQYLRAGQIHQPASALDLFDPNGFNQYGNWVWWEYLSRHYGNSIVKSVWNRAGAFQGAPDQYSTQAMKSVLAGRGGFPRVYGRYVGANVLAARSYPEGAAWPAPHASASYSLGRKHRSVSRTFSVNHMASRLVVLHPGSTIKGSRWKMRVVVNGPGAKVAKGAHLVIRKKGGKVVTKAIPLSRNGYGKVGFSFSRSSVRKVSISLINASTRFSCYQNASYSCQGKPLDQDKPFAFKARIYR